jgi:Domain of unknown function (DUF4157)
MTAKVIQGSFLSGQPKLSSPTPTKPALPQSQTKTDSRPPSPPAPSLSGRAQPLTSPRQPNLPRQPGPPTPAFSSPAQPLVSPHQLPGPPAPAFARRPGPVQRHSAGGAFAVNAGLLGLASSGGRPLPEAVRGKMETALRADFSNVRVHVGPQAERIGAIAFTIGSDIYFAPGRYQPNTSLGQQLLGHELAHVVQQRAGRVRNPLGTRIAVVQDHALEAEADRLGRHASAQAKMPLGAVQLFSTKRIPPPIGYGPGGYHLNAVQRMRTKYEQSQNFVVLGDFSYTDHVKLRIRLFATLLLKIVGYRTWCVNQDSPTFESLTSALNATAKNQVGVGIYNNFTGEKYDAAHFINTTVKGGVLKSMAPALTPDQAKAIDDLEIESGATSMQLKSYNTSSDKVIDGCFTALREKVENESAAGVTAIVLLKFICTSCKKALAESSNASEPQYQAAISATDAVLSDIGGMAGYVEEDAHKWLAGNKFVS